MAAGGEPPERCHLGCARSVERVGFVIHTEVFRPYFTSTHDNQPRGFKRTEQLGPGSQAQVLREIGQNQPPLAPWLQVRRQRTQEPEQHAAIRVIDPALDRGAGTSGNPWWIAYNERGAPLGKQIGLYNLHLFLQPQTPDILDSAHQRTRILIGGDHPADAAPGEHGSQHTRPRADIEGHTGRRPTIR